MQLKYNILMFPRELNLIGVVQFGEFQEKIKPFEHFESKVFSRPTID